MSLYSRTIIGLVGACLLTSTSSASAICLKTGDSITGTLEQVTTRNNRGRMIKKYVLVPDQRVCVQIRPRRRLRGVERLEISASNASNRELDLLLGQSIAVEGLYTRASKRVDIDARIMDAHILGAFDPRTNRFRNWRYLKRRLVRLDDTYRAPSRSDARELDRIIRNATARDREIIEPPRNRAFEQTTSNTVDEEILKFIIENYLQFSQMTKAEVVQFYAPRVSLNGSASILREVAVNRKFQEFRQWPNQVVRLRRRTLRIRENRQLPGTYDVSFTYLVRSTPGRRPILIRKTVNLLLDLDLGDIVIRRESDRRQSRVY